MGSEDRDGRYGQDGNGSRSGRFFAECCSAEELYQALFDGIKVKKANAIEISLKRDCVLICNTVVTHGAYDATAFPTIPVSTLVRIQGNGARFCRTYTKGSSQETILISPAYRYFEVRGRLELNAVQLDGGFAKEANGGGVYVHAEGELLVTESTVSACASKGKDGFPGSTRFGAGGGEPALGGAIYAERAKLELARCVFKDNCAYGGNGGSIQPSRTVARDIEDVSARSIRKRIDLGAGGDGGNVKTSAQVGGLFGGHGGLVLQETPSAGGGGAALGGAVFARQCSVLVRDCRFHENKCVPGQGGVQAWGHPNGKDGSSVGGAMFAWGSLHAPSIVFESGCHFLGNEAQQFSNEFDRFAANEVRLAPKLLFKPTFTWADIAHRLFAAITTIRLPIILVRKIVEEYVDWVFPDSMQTITTLEKKLSHKAARSLLLQETKLNSVMPLSAQS